MNKIITLKKECLKIKNIATNLPNNIFFTIQLINELILLNLKVEKILFDKKKKKWKSDIIGSKFSKMPKTKFKRSFTS